MDIQLNITVGKVWVLLEKVYLMFVGRYKILKEVYNFIEMNYSTL